MLMPGARTESNKKNDSKHQCDGPFKVLKSSCLGIAMSFRLSSLDDPGLEASRDSNVYNVFQ